MPAAKTNPDLPDFCLDADAVLRDDIPSWRYGRAPDYTNTRKVYRQTKSQDHEPGCPENIIENLVKNWEVEASFKQDINDWRTIDKDNYTFAINGGKAQSAEHMLKVGTYNAVITPNEYYSPEHSDFNSSHKTFKRMMPTFAWEVIEVFGKPPNVSFKWRHWGVMKNDYVGFNEAGEKVTVKAHGGQIDFQGLTVAKLTPDLRIQSLDTFFDPIEMFRQIGRGGVIEKVPVGRLGKYKLLPGETHNDYHGMDDHIQKFPENDPLGSGSPPTTPVTKDGGIQRSDTPPEDAPPVPAIPAQFLSGNGSGNGSPNEDLPFRQKGDHLHARPMSPAESYRSTRTHDTISFEEMSKMTPADCPFLMKWRTAGLEQESRASSVMGDDQIGGGGNPWGGIETIVETSEETVVTYE